MRSLRSPDALTARALLAALCAGSSEVLMEPEFEFGPISRGIYIALICITAVIPLFAPEYFLRYVIFLAFLGFGLRTFLVKTGLYNLWNNVGGILLGKWDRKYLEKRASDIDRGLELEKYRKSRYRDPRLPKKW